MNKSYPIFIGAILIMASIVACTSTQMATSSPVIMPTTLPISPTMSVEIENSATTIQPSQTTVGVDNDQVNSTLLETNRMNIQIGSTMLSATLVENSSTNGLKKALANGPITINMRDYGNMEKVGPLGMDLPRNDQQITTEPGDIILYQGNALVIYYAPNSWNFTRIGKIDNLTSEMLKEILGDGNVTITISLPD